MNITLGDCDAFIDVLGNIFMVLGHVHPFQRTRCRWVYRRIQSNPLRYKKVVYDRSLARAELPQNYFLSDHVYNWTLAVPNNEIVEVFRSQEMFQERFHTLPLHLRTFVMMLSEVTEIPKSRIGLFGSWLVGIEHGESDLDLVIFGEANQRRFFTNKQALIQRACLSVLPSKSLEERAQLFSRCQSLPVPEIMRVLERRQTKYAVHNTPVSISFSWFPHESPVVDNCPMIRSIRFAGSITDDTRAFLMPRIYGVSRECDNYAVMTYEYFFKEVATKGDRVRICGILREGSIITIERPGDFILPHDGDDTII